MKFVCGKKNPSFYYFFYKLNLRAQSTPSNVQCRAQNISLHQKLCSLILLTPHTQRNFLLKFRLVFLKFAILFKTFLLPLFYYFPLLLIILLLLLLLFFIFFIKYLFDVFILFYLLPFFFSIMEKLKQRNMLTSISFAIYILSFFIIIFFG